MVVMGCDNREPDAAFSIRQAEIKQGDFFTWLPYI